MGSGVLDAHVPQWARERQRDRAEPDPQAPQDCVATRRGKDPRGPQSDSCFLGVTQKAPMARSRCRAAKGTCGMHSPAPCPGVTLVLEQEVEGKWVILTLHLFTVGQGKREKERERW